LFDRLWEESNGSRPYSDIGAVAPRGTTGPQVPEPVAMPSSDLTASSSPSLKRTSDDPLPSCASEDVTIAKVIICLAARQPQVGWDRFAEGLHAQAPYATTLVDHPQALDIIMAAGVPPISVYKFLGTARELIAAREGKALPRLTKHIKTEAVTSSSHVEPKSTTVKTEHSEVPIKMEVFEPDLTVKTMRPYTVSFDGVHEVLEVIDSSDQDLASSKSSSPDIEEVEEPEQEV
jgi:hypothetical protein